MVHYYKEYEDDAKIIIRYSIEEDKSCDGRALLDKKKEIVKIIEPAKSDPEGRSTFLGSAIWGCLRELGDIPTRRRTSTFY